MTCKLKINLLKEFTLVAKKKTSKGLLIHLGQSVRICQIFFKHFRLKGNTMWPLESSMKDLIFTLAHRVVSTAHILNFLHLLPSMQNRYKKRKP